MDTEQAIKIYRSFDAAEKTLEVLFETVTEARKEPVLDNTLKHIEDDLFWIEMAVSSARKRLDNVSCDVYLIKEALISKQDDADIDEDILYIQNILNHGLPRKPVHPKPLDVIGGEACKATSNIPNQPSLEELADRIDRNNSINLEKDIVEPFFKWGGMNEISLSENKR